MNRLMIVFAIVAASCKVSKNTEDTHSADNLVVTGPVMNSELYRTPSKSFEIMFAELSGDTLMTRVSYSGGCSEHSFTLVAPEDRLVSDSKTELRIIHRSNDDYCDSTLVRDLKFNLTKIPLNSSKVTLKGYRGEL